MMLDGNVAAYVKGADLVIVGDDQPNEVAIFQLASSVNGMKANAYIVLGGEGGTGGAAEEPTTINGQPFVVIPGPQRRTSDMCIDLRGGNDALILGNVGHFNDDTGGTLPEVVSLLFAMDDNGFADMETDCFLVRDDVFIRMGAGDDLLGMDGFAVGDDLSIDTGSPISGGGSYFLGYDPYLFGYDDLVGYDEVVAVFNSAVYDDATIVTREGRDAVIFGAGVSEEGNTGLGYLPNDPFGLGTTRPGIYVRDNLKIDTGSGDDDIWLNVSSIRTATISMGAGSDNLSLETCYIRQLSVDGGNRDLASIDTIYGLLGGGNQIRKTKFRQIESYQG
jgi:hypothetical protein